MARQRLLASIALLAAVSCYGQFPDENERLLAVARLWITVEYFHPALVNGAVDWDQALVNSIPKIRSARGNAEYQSAIAALLNELHDPQTHILQGDLKASDPPTLRQWSRAHHAAEEFLLVTETPAATQRIVLDVAGVQVLVRLSAPVNSMPAAPAVQPNSPKYADAFPSVELRILAAFKTWGVIHYQFAYRDLMDDDWDAVFAAALPKLIQARDATEYNLALADLLTHLTDTNSAPHSQTLDAYFGEASVGLSMRLLDKYPIVTAVTDPAAIAAGVHPGDILKSVGGESTTYRFRRFVQYVAASTAQRSGYDTLRQVTNGPVGSEVELMIENTQGEARAVRLIRTTHASGPQRSGDAVRLLSGNIGYLDLDRLTPEAAEEALLRFKDTKALIFDLRGASPAGEVIATHLTTQSNLPVELVTSPFPMHPDEMSAGIATQTASTFVVRTMPTPRAPLYKGTTIALIDERTIGPSEYAALLFEAANKTEFVGEPSAGALSLVARLPLPGAITITYSAEDIRHANGGKLQRLGIQPNVLAPTTAKGLRAGKDEARDAALAVLNK